MVPRVNHDDNYNPVLERAYLLLDVCAMCITNDVRPEKFQFLEKGQNRNFGYEIVNLVKSPKFIL